MITHKIYLLLVALVLAAALPAAAQQEVSTRKSLKGGLVFGRFDNIRYDSDASPGFSIGVAVDVLLHEHFSVQSEVIYTEKGGKVTGNTLDTEFDLTMDFVEIPVLAKYRFSTHGLVRPHLFAGPYFAFLIENNSNTEVMDDQAYTPDDLVEDARTTDWGLMFGVGTELAFTFNTVSTELRYSTGLSRAFSGSAPGKIRNGALCLLLGFSF